MKVTNDKIKHSASAACGLTLSLGMTFMQLIFIAPKIISGSYKLIHWLPLIVGSLLFFSVGYLVCRFLLLILYPIYFRVSKKLSISIFCLTGAIVAIIPLFFMDALYRSAMDISFSMDLKKIVGHTLVGFLGSSCAISAWYVLKKHDPNKTLQRTSR